jgi:hypothetical protein
MHNPAVLLVHVLYLHVTQDLQTVTRVQQMDVKQTCNQIQAIVELAELYVPVEAAVLMEHVVVQQDNKFVVQHLHHLEHVQTLQQQAIVEFAEMHVPVEAAVLMEHVAVQQDKQFVVQHLHHLEHVQTLQQMLTVEFAEMHAGT